MSNALQKVENESVQTLEKRSRRPFLRPHYEVKETAESVRLQVYLPGVPKDQAEITLEQDSLRVDARRAQHWKEGWRRIHQEMPEADYRLVLEFNNRRFNGEKITATARDGVLTIDLPIAEEAKTRTISVA